ncbi:MAG: pyruvate formate-lyase-activating protein [Clostridia bacterium]|nr:pyruvate formate-lyase-activating protein [Clostridia bacterium]
MKGYVKSIETFGSVDGPGVRFVAFLGGCNMRCKFCHNPETWKKDGEEYTPRELFDRAVKYKSYWKKDGGITVSGGEPLLQMDFITELFSLAKSKGVNTAVDTAGQPFSTAPEYIEKFEKLMEVTDLVILDLKEMDEKKHIALTGVTNLNILQMARWLSDNGKHMWIRHVLVPGITDDIQGLKDMRDFIDTLNNVDRVEILPYHTLGISKWHDLGIKYELEEIVPPDKDQIKIAEQILCK